MNNQQVTIGIDIGGTKIAAGLVTPEGEVLGSNTVPTPVTEGPEAMLQAVIDQATALRNQMINVDISQPAERVSTATELPIYVDNDVNALAVGTGIDGANSPQRTNLARCTLFALSKE